MAITKPTVGGSQDTWGQELNDALDYLDTAKLGPYLGAWSAVPLYQPGSVVSHEGILYVALDGADPAQTPGVSGDWLAMTVPGPTGATGEQGPQGTIAAMTSSDQLVWAGDTNLYRGAANILKTDDSLQVVGGVTAGQGAADSLTMSGDDITAVGSNANHQVRLHTKGTGSVRMNGDAGDGTGGLNVYSGGASPVARVQLAQSGAAAFLSPPIGISALRVFMEGLATHRFTISEAGVLSWGDGTAAVDTNLYRHAANVLRTDDAFRVAAFTTGGRPTAATVGAGTMIYDTTLSKPVFSDGTVWRDAAGTAV